MTETENTHQITTGNEGAAKTFYVYAGMTYPTRSMAEAARRTEQFRLEDEALDHPSPAAYAALAAFTDAVYGPADPSEDRRIAQAEVAR